MSKSKGLHGLMEEFNILMSFLNQQTKVDASAQATNAYSGKTVTLLLLTVNHTKLLHHHLLVLLILKTSIVFLNDKIS